MYIVLCSPLASFGTWGITYTVRCGHYGDYLASTVHVMEHECLAKSCNMFDFVALIHQIYQIYIA